MDLLLAMAATVLLTTPIELPQVKTTGYCPGPPCVDEKWADGKTATGTTAREGVCAANWKTFVPGMVFEIPGYGICRVEDTGNPKYISGQHLDLYFETEEEGLQWGVKNLQIKLVGVPDGYKQHIFQNDVE